MTHIFLYGSPATGKTTIGKILADNLNLSFIDLDKLIEEKAGMSISNIIKSQGETTFRDLESAALKESVSHALHPEWVFSVTNSIDKVISLGGGALLREENRKLAESNGIILLLNADINILLPRLKNNPNQRPLLTGNLESNLKSLLEKRKEHYASFPLQINVDNKTPQQTAFDVQTKLGRYHLSSMAEYDVIVGQIANLTYGNLIVTDENIAKHHAQTIEKLNIKTIIIPAGEEYKNLETVNFLWKSFLENGLDRKSTVIALGGGVIGDLVGFAASTYMRGIDWIAVPTTLLSMVDASLGGKTGFDLPQGKNLIGSFHPPKLVLADTQFLKTLPERELISGMAEVIKHGIISDPQLFNLCNKGLDWIKENLEEIVKRAMAVKIKIIEQDPYEKNIRAKLNLGHTVGHAVELVSKFNLTHGESIAIGMVAEAKYAAKVGITNKNIVEAIESTLKKLNLPTQIPNELPKDEIINAMKVDKKKNAKSIRFALPVEIGKVELVDVDNLESVFDD